MESRRARAMRQAGEARIRYLVTLPLFLFKICTILVVMGAFVFYLANLPDSGAYFTSWAQSDSMTVTFGGGVQQASATAWDEAEESDPEPEHESVEPEPVSDPDEAMDDDPESSLEGGPDPEEVAETDPEADEDTGADPEPDKNMEADPELEEVPEPHQEPDPVYLDDAEDANG